MLKMSIEAKSMRFRRLNPTKIANDNDETMMSGLSWTEQAKMTQRIEDLKWQVNYADIQLKSWRDLENGKWDALKEMREKAQMELNQIRFG